MTLLFGSTSKEFVHLFVGHQDTVHHVHGSGELSFESQHHHCTFVSFVLAPFVKHSLTFSLHSAPNLFVLVAYPLCTFMSVRVFSEVLLRGPPSLGLFLA
ncbi:MAG: hypothetical protein JST52_01865 [Bacteroidetes bacterium]|nr:hypothetical protein [Bacteroidota bacterium]MBS1740260.1 hypothetical protein [Bacteroidota bacterium]